MIFICIIKLLKGTKHITYYWVQQKVSPSHVNAISLIKKIIFKITFLCYKIWKFIQLNFFLQSTWNFILKLILISLSLNRLVQKKCHLISSRFVRDFFNYQRNLRLINNFQPYKVYFSITLHTLHTYVVQLSDGKNCIAMKNVWLIYVSRFAQFFFTYHKKDFLLGGFGIGKFKLTVHF